MRKVGLWAGILAAGAAVACSHPPVQTGVTPSTGKTELVAAVTPSVSPNGLEKLIEQLPGFLPLNPPASPSVSPDPLEKLLRDVPGWLPLNPPSDSSHPLENLFHEIPGWAPLNPSH